MNFAELRFWQLLALGLLTLLSLRVIAVGFWPGCSKRFDEISLVSLGLFLLLCVSRTTCVVFLVVAIGTYVGLFGLLRAAPDARRRWMLVFVPLQLLPLVYYKYANFVGNQILGLGFDSLRDLVIPVGISFYTFQKVAFVVDTLAARQPLPRFLDYMNFAGFFPQIVAGPIERRKDLLPQMQAFRWRWLPQDIDVGAQFIAVGMFFKCCLADNLALYFDGRSTTNPFLIWFANLIFGLRIYYDFAGYSLVAVGVARCLGVRLTVNFASPYCSTNVSEFWRRWHITLSQWFRDYLYIPLGGSRVRWWAANLAIVFVVSGVWHGAGWGFVLWGALHGGWLIIHRLFAARWKAPIPVTAGWALTMACAFLAWLCFYEVDTPSLMAKMQAVFTPAAYSVVAFKEAVNRWAGGEQFAIACLLILVGAILLLEWRSVARTGEPYSLLRRPVPVVILVVLTVWLSPGKNNGFIYFAF